MCNRVTEIRQIFTCLAILALLTSCGNSSDEDKQTTEPITESSKSTETNDEDGPPFKDECLASFHRFGEYRISNDNCNIYYSGKNWNPTFYSCSWTWGELVYNEFPDDTNVTRFTIHLLDLDNFPLPDNGTEYGNDSLKKYVIAIFSRDKDGGKEKSIFDPFNTGKYPKPKQWTD